MAPSLRLQLQPWARAAAVLLVALSLPAQSESDADADASAAWAPAPARQPPPLENAAAYDSAGDNTHPVWEGQWEHVMRPEVLRCSLALFFSGVLCSAAGVGGGGVYVAVLMVNGQLSAHNAVPLSKAIVLFGAVASLGVNLFRQHTPGGSVIDLEACFVVVPAALVGTFLGVLLNWHVRDLFIVGTLSILLAIMSALVVRTAWTQRQEELQAMAQEQAGLTAASEALAGGPPGAGDAKENPQDPSCEPAAAPPSSEDAPQQVQESVAFSGMEGLRGADAFMAAWLLVIVILSGVLRFHMRACWDERVNGIRLGSCRHPLVMTLFGGALELWMSDYATATVLQAMAMSLPIWSCSVVAAYYGHLVCSRGKWSVQRVALFQVTAAATGVLAGLVGIGGGLVLSPFFLLTGMDPAVAVGTSSTCVLFTSSSTTMQYAFTDRIIMSLALVYGLVTFAASCSGTTLVHLLRVYAPMRKSWISLVVALTVAISVGLVMLKLVRLLTQGSSPGGSAAAQPASLLQMFPGPAGHSGYHSGYPM